MADFNPAFEIRASDAGSPAEILEGSGIRHCIVGDFVVLGLEYPIVPCDVQITVNDDELESARSVLAKNGYNEVPQTHERFFCETASRESKTGWPGYRFLPDGAGPHATSTIIMPASYWHFDLSPHSWEGNTFLVPNTPYRFPRRVPYLRSIIDVVSDRYVDEGLNFLISGYFQSHYAYLTHLLKDIIEDLPIEDRYFVENFKRGMLNRARKMVCRQRLQIREGTLTPEAAKALVPRPDLRVEELKRKHRERDAADAKAKETEVTATIPTTTLKRYLNAYVSAGHLKYLGVGVCTCALVGVFAYAGFFGNPLKRWRIAGKNWGISRRLFGMWY